MTFQAFPTLRGSQLLEPDWVAREHFTHNVWRIHSVHIQQSVADDSPTVLLRDAVEMVSYFNSILIYIVTCAVAIASGWYWDE